MNSSPRARIVVAEKVNESAMARLQAAGEVISLDNHDETTLINAVREADALVVRTYALVNANVITAARQTGRLKVIGRAGVGVDNIDVPAALQAGIQVVNTPAASTCAVTELVVGLIVAVQRHIAAFDARIRQGEFATLRAGPAPTPELQHQTLGIIGMGRIGRAVGYRMRNGMGMRVMYYDIREIGYLPFATTPASSAEEVYAACDVVTFHVPLTAKTRNMVNAAALRHFKPGAYLINTSRGPVVNAADLASALTENRLGGAAVDVFDPEPPPPDHPLLSAPNCLLTPHIGARSREGLAAMNDVVDDVIAVLAGRTPQYPVEPEPC
ncbi:MAG TPA: NAD(P)-dependent oxidoreductase [Phycisphaerae bacterium]|nr:NAD(P)-dependent oxidoreductase [Phycisphaerae bacterium]HRY67797.1 NAD(P)-dependent oxidoreductase [Phycisphaerae bacterium]HSA25249.1 NAD(P)-dependent oxidoreductase [Phycisphaerae bacterium]